MEGVLSDSSGKYARFASSVNVNTNTRYSLPKVSVDGTLDVLTGTRQGPLHAKTSVLRLKRGRLDRTKLGRPPTLT